MCLFVTVAIVCLTGCTSEPPALGIPKQAVSVQLPRTGLYYGDPNAPVILVEFGSFACSVCRAFTFSVYPKLDSLYVRHGTLRYRYVDVSPPGLYSHFASINECLVSPGVSMALPEAKRLIFEKVVLISDPRAAIALAAEKSRSSADLMLDCVDAAPRITERHAEMEAAARLAVQGTPTFIVGQLDANGRVIGWPYIGLDYPDSLGYLIDAAARVIAHAHSHRGT